MRMPIFLASVLWPSLLLGALTSLAWAKVEVSQEDGHLSYKIAQTPFLTAKSKKELSSGVSSQIVILARVVEIPNRIVTQQIMSLDAKYNLWEENFRLQYSDGRKVTLKKQIELEAAIEGPGPFVIYQFNELKNEASYEIQVIQTVNPLEADRMEAVRKWVVGQKSTLQAAGSPTDQANRGTGLDTAFTELFYGLWKRASAGEVLVGELRRELTSEPFTKSSLSMKKKAEAL